MTTSTEQIEHLVEDIRVRLVENRYDDPGLANDLLAYVMRELGCVATGAAYFYDPAELREWASGVMLAAQSRAVAGGWPAPAEYPYEHVLSDGDGDLG